MLRLCSNWINCATHLLETLVQDVRTIKENQNYAAKIKKDSFEHDLDNKKLGDTEEHLNKGNNLYDLGKHDEAIKCYDEAIN